MTINPYRNSGQPSSLPVTGQPRVIAVASGKGGVGKTSLSVNLGLALVAAGERVILWDADLGLSNAEVLLGVNPAAGLLEVVLGQCGIDEVMTSASGLQLISGGSGLAELANLSELQRQRLVREIAGLALKTDFLILDTGAGLGKVVLGFVEAAEEVIVVVTPEPTSMTDAYGLIKVLDRYRLQREVMVVVNRVQNEKEAAQVFRRLQTVAGRYLPNIEVKAAGHVREDAAMGLAVRQQVPLVTLRPQAPAARDMADLARYLRCGRPAGDTASGFMYRLLKLFG
ncbi:MAG TPA: MinD/ParA family protein [Spirochaetia bacterium]|nr:MinD/ParA family protein [Spirochaetia bacterium]